MEVRMRYGVEMPSSKTRNRILEDFPQVTGQQLSFWRQNKEAEDKREMAFFDRHLRCLCE
jgi:hypothetical protein